jgi:hypothetical protein
MWLDGWFCNPAARYYANLEITSFIDVYALADPVVEESTRVEIICDYLTYHRLQVVAGYRRASTTFFIEDYLRSRLPIYPQRKPAESQHHDKNDYYY